MNASAAPAKIPVEAALPRRAALAMWLERNPSVQALFRSKIFWAVLAAKVVVGSILGSYYIRDLFVPFLNYYVGSHFANPWTHFVQLGRVNSFPYPPVMLYFLAVPRLLFAWALPSGTDVVTWGHLLVMRLPLLACDLAIAVMLALWFPGRHKRILGYYWCSPLVFYVCYWHGQLDIIPTALFTASLFVLQRHRLNSAMFLLGLSLASKTHLFAALPFLFVYLWQEYGIARTLRAALVALATFLLVLAPYASPAFMLMVFGTQEQSRLVALQVPIGAQTLLLVAPGAILLLWFRFLAYRQRNWDLLMLYLGILFSIFVLLAPPAPGYVLWSLPFLLHFLCRSRGRDALAFLTYGIAYLVFIWVRQGSDLFDAWRTISPSIAALPSPYAWLSGIDPKLAVMSESVSFTVLQASLAGVVLFMYVAGVRRNEAHNARVAPTMVGVAGDSGAGKDAFVAMVCELIGEERVARVAGDDYHRWPRGHAKWRELTHLDLRANRLHQQHRDAVHFASGRPVLKTEYDHHSGTYSPDLWTDPEDVMIFQGLHTLSIEALRKMFDLAVFLDPDEELRRAWKVERDGRERGYSPEQVLKSLEARQPDRDAYILPQREDAELVIRWKPVQPGVAAGALALEVQASNSFDFEELVTAFLSVPTLRVTHDYHEGRKQLLRLEGEISGEQVCALAERCVHDHAKLFLRARYRAGLEGCLQLIFASSLAEKTFWRQSWTMR